MIVAGPCAKSSSILEVFVSIVTAIMYEVVKICSYPQLDPSLSTYTGLALHVHKPSFPSVASNLIPTSSYFVLPRPTTPTFRHLQTDKLPNWKFAVFQFAVHYHSLDYSIPLNISIIQVRVAGIWPLDYSILPNDAITFTTTTPVAYRCLPALRCRKDDSGVP